MIEQIINLERLEEAIDIFGSFDQNMRILEEGLGISVVIRGDQLKINGEPEAVMQAVRAVESLLTLAGRGETITEIGRAHV